MVQTRAQSKALSPAKGTVQTPLVVYPKTNSYTFIDEKWILQTVHPKRFFSRNDEGIYRPVGIPRCFAMGVPNIGPRTMAEKAAAEDVELWESCRTVDEFNTRQTLLSEQKSFARKNWLESQPTFHSFQKLPVELRLKVWKFAMEEPTEVRITCSGYTARRRCSTRCGTMSSQPRIYAATAFLPPLLLVNRESHSLAYKRYRRAFRGVNGGGGVLTAYPTTLIVEQHVAHLIPQEDFELVHKLVDNAGSRGGWPSFDVMGMSDEKFRAVLQNPNLRKLENRYSKGMSAAMISSPFEYLKQHYLYLRDAIDHWAAPEVRIVHVTPGEEDEVVARLEGDLIETMGILSDLE